MSVPTRSRSGAASEPTPGVDPGSHASPTKIGRPSPRVRFVSWLLASALAVLTIVAVGVGDYPLSPVDVVQAIFAGIDGGFASTVVLEWRMPRAIAALAFGAALGVAGALFQTVTRNPLGSPDIIGFTTGSYTGVLVGLVLFGGSYLSTSIWAMIGGPATAALVYVLAFRRGVQGFRLIIVGIGITAMLSSLNTWLLLQAETEVAMSASIWAAGSLNLTQWSQVWPALILLGVLAPAVSLLARPLRQLELGDDSAKAHGVSVEASRIAIMAIGVALTAAVTAAAGPIAFIALAAPQVAARLMRTGGLPLLGSALLGAFLLLLADLIAQHVMPAPVPVGTVTVVIGGIYLIYVLAQQARRSV